MTVAFRSTRDVIIRTEAWADAVAFYTNVLGFEVMYRSENIVGLETGALRLYVEKGASHGPVFEFLVPDVPAAKAALLAEGCEVLEEDPGVPRCYLRDPHGLTFNLGASSP